MSRLFKWQTTNTLATVEDTTDGEELFVKYTHTQFYEPTHSVYTCALTHTDNILLIEVLQGSKLCSAGPLVIPHFSQPELASRYARVEHLSYLHYLTRGQPSFAFANFMAAKLLGHSNTTRRYI